MDARAAIERWIRLGLRKVYGTARMWFDQPADDNHVMIGFSAIAYDDIAPGVAVLHRAWFA